MQIIMLQVYFFKMFDICRLNIPRPAVLEETFIMCESPAIPTFVNLLWRKNIYRHELNMYINRIYIYI